MSDSEPVSTYPGLDRLNYFLGKVGLIAVIVFVIVVFGPGPMRYVTLPLMVASIVLDVLRLRNIGLSQWFAFARFLPFGNTILDIFLLSAQGGWAETRRWDRAGRRILLVEFLLIALMFVMYFRHRPSIPYWF